MQRLKIYVIGLLNDENMPMQSEAKKAINRCDFLFVSSRLLKYLEYIEMKEKIHLFPDKLSELPELIKKCVKDCHKEICDIAVFATGDPNFFGITPFIKRSFPDAEVEVIPNLSTMQQAFAKLALNWDDAAFESIHGRKRESLLPFFLKNKKGFLFTSNAEDVLYVLKCLKENRLDDYTVYILENLGTLQERVIKITYPFLLKSTVSDLNVVIFTREVVQGPYPGIGIPEEEFKSKGGMITKKEVRANVISLLNLKEGTVLWDIGAGSGSVSIEAAFNPVGTLVFAIEKDEEAYLNLKENIKKFGAYNVKPILAEFIDVYHTLPEPDRVFIGGGKSEENLPVAFHRLKEGGVMVIALVSIENLVAAVTFAKKFVKDYELTEINFVRKENIKGTALLKGNNPIFLMKIMK
ncbi:MAG: bifunctional cobalt-precorrin-7 (C(5))-methyltransferase/cobalt-precorrin-6B (C(15))-methyltransferase [bacterium]